MITMLHYERPLGKDEVVPALDQNFSKETREEFFVWMLDEHGPELTELARKFIDGEIVDRKKISVDDALSDI